jgi:citrate lyase subunit beta/citryl-CoA lyase
MLFVPGDSERKLAKAADAGADALILDLEDSVAASEKARARWPRKPSGTRRGPGACSCASTRSTQG